MLLNAEIEIDQIDLGTIGIKDIELKIARLDKIHPIISGNKLYKLHYFFEAFKNSGKNSIATFGGAYSNHLVATAYAAKQLSVPSRGFVRGENSGELNDTLKDCISYDMELIFLSRQEYSSLTKNISQLPVKFSDSYIIPEGGYHPLGALGASLISDKIMNASCTHLCTAVGTATTVAGLLRKNHAHVIGIPVLKGLEDLVDRIRFLNGEAAANLEVWDEYHFGGYARSTAGLIDFMNRLYNECKIPTDFVYTAKMMFAVLDKIKNGYFPLGSSVICLHTGGLQGNRSLPGGILNF